MNFNLDEAIKTANQVVYLKFHRQLTDLEILVLKGAWERLEYDEIAAKHQYATTYISQDIAPKLWKVLTDALGEKVKKSNFKEALKRRWSAQVLSSDVIVSQPLKTDEEPESLPINLYVERPPIELMCCENILQPGSLTRIKAPKLMGKTYLFNWVLNKIYPKEYRTVNLSFELADRSKHFTNLDKFLRWLCINISRELKLPSHLDEYWDEEGMGSKVSCTTYFEEYLLVQEDNPLVLCLDDVDLLFPHPEVYEDFFGLLRSWYEKARSRKLWQKLRLVIVHSTDVYIQLNINQSPFNVGLPIELPEFNQEQVQEFAQQHGLLANTALIVPLMDLLGGHPYLLEQAFTHIKHHPEITLNQLLVEATTEAGIYRHHLREIWLKLQEHPELAPAFQQVVTADDYVQIEPMAAYQLQSMGLVKLSGNQVQIRCNLYRQYFQMRLADGK
jgi:hypothetical protein